MSDGIPKTFFSVALHNPNYHHIIILPTPESQMIDFEIKPAAVFPGGQTTVLSLTDPLVPKKIDHVLNSRPRARAPMAFDGHNHSASMNIYSIYT